MLMHFRFWRTVSHGGSLYLNTQKGEARSQVYSGKQEPKAGSSLWVFIERIVCPTGIASQPSTACWSADVPENHAAIRRDGAKEQERDFSRDAIGYADRSSETSAYIACVRRKGRSQPCLESDPFW